jgi:hypothetical protein
MKKLVRQARSRPTKRHIIEALYTAWLTVPSWHLGRLLMTLDQPSESLVHMRDDRVLAMLEQFGKTWA